MPGTVFMYFTCTNFLKNLQAGWVRLGQKVIESPSQPIKLGVMAHTCHPSYGGSINKKIVV
jgi:hypothetical protein